ncbi:hypothetical protein TNCV_4653461 [Trichonephila clavipes]|nr:hypothetical protein TNCV_4653461 [Trichonephila clavipes]
MNSTWRNPPAHLSWYAAESPDLSLQCRSSRAHQTALAHLKEILKKNQQNGSGSLAAMVASSHCRIADSISGAIEDQSGEESDTR